jgi:large subunit ribosomal protein L6
MPIPVPQGVTVTIQDCQVTVKGPKGELMREFHPDMSIVREGDVLKVTRPSDQRMHRALHGLTRALLANMVTGVSQGFTKGLEIEGTGYRAELQGKNLVVNVGYSHPVQVIPPAGISFSLDKTGRNLAVEGIDKQLVGEVAARIRAIRKPEPYKGKGIRYAGERVRRKAGKAGKVGK